MLDREPQLAIPDEPWMGNALCTEIGGDLFFSENKGDTAGLRDAKRICQLCPVQIDCLQFAMDNNEAFGIWGGLSTRERRRIQRGLTPARSNRRANGHGYSCCCNDCKAVA